MENIANKTDWLATTMADMLSVDLCKLLSEITSFSDTGILPSDAALREVERKYSTEVTHTRYGEMLRTVENAVLYEMARRYNNSIAAMQTNTIHEPAIPHTLLLDDKVVSMLQQKYPNVEGIVATFDERTPYIIEGMTEDDVVRFQRTYAPKRETNNFFENGKCYCTTSTLGNFIADALGYQIAKDTARVHLTTALDDAGCYILFQEG